MFKKLYLNLLFTFSILVVASVLIVGFYIGYYSNHFYMEALFEDLEDDAGFLNDNMTGEAVLDNDREYLKAIVNRAETGAQITIFDKKRNTLAETLKGPPFDFIDKSEMPELIGALNGKTTRDIRENPSRRSIIYLAVPVQYRNKIVGALRISHDLSSLQKLMKKVRRRIFAGSAIAVTVTMLAGIYLARSISRPILHMGEIAGLVSHGKFDQKVNVKNKDEIKKLADSFNRMIRQLKELEESRRDFIANTSHELLTPLTSIHGFVETLQKGAIKRKEAYEFLEIIKKESEYLEHLIKDLLLLSKMEGVEIKVDFKTVSLAEAAGDVAAAFLVKMQAKRIEFNTDIADNLPLIKADEKSIRQMIGNLLDNAIKYTPNGGTISLTLQKENNTVRISVKDSGRGIPPEHLENIFKRFYRVDKSRHDEGSGLGLAIVEHIVTAHHGRLYAKSEPGKGSIFHIILPA